MHHKEKRGCIIKTLIAEVNWDDKGQPISTQYEDIYFSKYDGIEETNYVFIMQNELQARFSSLNLDETFTIAETGFGSGLNFLCTCLYWKKNAPEGTRLHFLSVEKFPLKRADIEAILKLWPQCQEFSKQLMAHYPSVDARGFHRLHFTDNITLTLIFEDAFLGLQQLIPIHHAGDNLKNLGYGWADTGQFCGFVDAWFLDGFAPAKNPEMWTHDLFKTMARLSFDSKNPKGRVTSFATFTAAGMVRRGLQDCGFTVEKVPGFGRKREMLRGTFKGEHPAASAATNDINIHQKRIKPDPSWHLCKPTNNNVEHVAIIGAGLAGTHTALALAKKGLKVTLIDRNKIASGASGNPVGIVYSKLSHSKGVFAEFNLSAYLYACSFYKRNHFFGLNSNCGVLQLAESTQQESQYQLIANSYQHSKDLVSWLNAEEASIKAGVKLSRGGLWLAQAGWLNPVELCKNLIAHPNITVIENTEIKQFIQISNSNQHCWQLNDLHNSKVISVDTVVIACAASAKTFNQCQHLPTKAIRGQISMISENDDSKKLKTVLCGTGYIAPADKHSHCTGATFDLKSNSTEIRNSDHNINLENANLLSTDFKNCKIADIESGRVSFRCTTPDYLPILGPVANANVMIDRFAGYRKNFSKVIDAPGEYWPGMYLNIGHGSKGLTYTPICAEILANIIFGEALPISRELMTHIHSARFLVRDLARNKL